MTTREQPAGEGVRVHAFGDDALGEHDAVGLVGEIRAGRMSRQEVVAAAVDRTRRLDERLHGLAVDRYAEALAEARRPAAGFFAGVPTFVKDNSDVEGLPTQHGSRAFRADPAALHGDVARAFELVGTTIIGKTRLSEYGFSASAEFAEEPPVRNPWDPAYTSGASSAGSAAFVAAGAVPMAHANDGGGSIRIPAACCGLVGLKATRGRIPSDRLNRQMPVRIVHDGVVTRTVRDTAAFVRECERVYRDLRLPPVGDVTRPGRARLRVAVVGESIGHRRPDGETTRVLRETAGVLAGLGHHVEEVDVPVPGTFADDFLDYWATLALFLELNGRRAFHPSYQRTRNDNLTRGLARHALRRSWRLPLSVARLRAAHRLTGPLFGRYDVVLNPVLARVTPPLGWLSPTQDYETLIDRLVEWVAFTPLQNATGEPAISLPMGAADNGLPVGVQLSAPRGYDRRLLEVAYELEEARPFRRIQGP